MTDYLPKTDNQQGSLMVFALLIVASLTIAGIMVANDATMEGRAARNYTINKQCLYAAMGSAQELIQFMNGMSGVVAINNSPWCGDAYNPPHFVFSLADWNNGLYNPFNAVNMAAAAPYPAALRWAPPTYQAMAVYEKRFDDKYVPPAPGQSSGTILYEYSIYGRGSNIGTGTSDSVVMIGYRRRMGV